MYVGCVCECVCIGYVKCEVCVGDCVLSVWSMLDGVVYVWESVCVACMECLSESVCWMCLCECVCVLGV